MSGRPEVPPALVFVVALHVSCAVVGWLWVARRLRRGRPLIPPQPFPECSWGFGSILCIILIWEVLRQFTTSALHAIITAGLPPGLSSNSTEPTLWFLLEQLISSAYVNAIMIVVILKLLKVTSGARPDQLGLTRRGAGRCILIGVAAHFLVTPPIYGLHYLALQIWPDVESLHKHPVERMLRTDATGSAVMVVVLSAVVIGPWLEEIVFRGVLLGFLRKVFAFKPAPLEDAGSEFAVADPDAQPPQTGPPAQPQWARFLRLHPLVAAVAPNLITSVCFAAVHASQWPAPVPLFFLSLTLGYLYLRTGSLIAPVTLHALLNFTSTIALLFGVS